MRAILALLLLCSTAQAGLVTFEDMPLGPNRGISSGGLNVGVSPQLTIAIIDLDGDRVVRITSPAAPHVYLETADPLGWTISAFDVHLPAATQLRIQGNFDSMTPWVYAEYNLQPGWSHIQVPAEFAGTRECFRVWAFPGVNEFCIDNVQWSNVPEPATWLLAVIGCGVLLLRRFIRAAR